MSNRRVIVIGAGIGGLSAAIELASKDIDVEVIEASPRPGGKAGITTIDGVEADTGPSVLTLPVVFDQLFKSAGTSLQDEVELLSPSPAFRYLFEDGVQVDVHHELESTYDSVEGSLGRPARDELQKFMVYARRIWDASEATFVMGGAPTLGTVVKFGLQGMKMLSHLDAARPMARAIEAKIRSPHLRDILLRYATYNGSNPFAAPATLNCIAHVELALGGYGIKGGVYSLIRALERVAQRAGANIRYDTPAASIDVDGGKAAGVRLAGGEQLSADAVVANAEPEQVFRRLLPESLSRGQRRIKTPSTSGWTGILRAPLDPARAPHTVLMPKTYRKEFEDLFVNNRPPQEPTVYLCDQRACHQRSGWGDAAPVFVMANAPAEPEGEASSSEVWDRLETAVRNRLTGFGLDSDTAPFVWKRTPTQLAETYAESRGALYGSASNSALSAFRRPPNRLSQPRGLYLASGAAHPGGGMPLCAASGRAAARAVVEDLGGVP